MMFNDLMHDGGGDDVSMGSKGYASAPEVKEMGGSYYMKGADGNWHIAGEMGLVSTSPEFAIVFLARAAISSCMSLLSSPKLYISGHTLERFAQRGFTREDVVMIMKKGTRIMGKSKYGERQYKYTYRNNTVIQNVNDGKIVTVFSNAPKTSTTPRRYKIPF